MPGLIPVQSATSTGDSTEYHRLYIDAVVTSPVAQKRNSSVPQTADWLIPSITFSTEDWTRRSMALNGMRMSTEYFANTSLRVLQLVDQRLQAGQTDVVHDVVVYLQERVLQAQSDIQEAQQLQAESLTAYVGLDAQRVAQLFATCRSAHEITQHIQAGFAGTIQRQLDLAALIENLWQRLCPDVERMQEHQRHVQVLVNEIAVRLYNFAESHLEGNSG